MNLPDLLDPGLTAGVGGLVVWVLRRAGKVLLGLLQLHEKLDAHIASDDRRAEANAESMRQIWRMVGERGDR